MCQSASVPPSQEETRDGECPKSMSLPSCPSKPGKGPLRKPSNMGPIGPLWTGMGSGQSFLPPPTPDTTNSSGKAQWPQKVSASLVCTSGPIGYLQLLSVRVQTGHNTVRSPGLQTAFSD